jgi:hypothetical protein
MTPRRSASWVAMLFGVSISLVCACRAETITPKYRDSPVPLDHFTCDWIKRSSFINRVCYDEANSYMIVQLKDTYYHYCGIDKAKVEAFKEAPSMGRYFNDSIKGHFDCRTGHVPAY